MTRFLSVIPATLVLILCVATLPGNVPAATLELVGPPGAVITIDGDIIGELPLPDVVTLSAGQYVIEAALKGTEPFERPIDIRKKDEHLVVNIRMTPLSRRDAVLTSLLIAGQGQRYEGRPGLGWALTITEAAGLLVALVSETQVQNHRSDYLLAEGVYREAISTAEIDAARADVQRLFDDMSSAADRRDAAILIAVGAVAISVIDAVVRFPALDAGVNLGTVGPFDSSSALSGGQPGFHVGLSWGF